MVTHVAYDKRDDQLPVKELIFWETKEDGEATFDQGDLREKSYPVGTYPLSEIINAYEDADPTALGTYNVVKNNCGAYMVELAQNLGAKINEDVTSFVAHRLTQDSPDTFVHAVRFQTGDWTWKSLTEWLMGQKSSQVEEDETIVKQMIDNQVAVIGIEG